MHLMPCRQVVLLLAALLSSAAGSVSCADEPPPEAVPREQSAQAAPVRHLITLGDSITKGVRSGVAAEQTFAGLLAADEQLRLRVTNVGVGGERTDQALRRIEEVLRPMPDLVTIMYGTNDSYVDVGKRQSRLSVEAYRANLHQLVAQVVDCGAQPILMTPPRWSRQGRKNGLGESPNLRLANYVEACREVAAEWRVPLVDHFADWSAAEEGGADLHAWTTDGCHPNPAGHERLSRRIAKVIAASKPRRLRAAERLSSVEPLRVVCFGDSVTGRYYHTGSRRAYSDLLELGLRRLAQAKVTVINAGVSGHTTVDALARIDKDVLAQQPDVVTVMFGLNDMTRVSLDDYRRNLAEIVAKCREAGAEVVLATPNNVSETPARPRAKLLAYCDAVRQTARQLDVPISDCHQAFQAARVLDTEQWSAWMSDAIHPNLAGHQKIAEQLLQTIAGRRVSLDDWRPTPPIQHLLRRAGEAERTGQAPAVKVLAMQGAAPWAAEAVRRIVPQANVELIPWSTEEQTLRDLEAEARKRVRDLQPDLVVLAVPRSAYLDDDSAQRHAYEWLINYSLNFGPPSWDVWIAHPNVAAWQRGPVSKRHAAQDEQLRGLARSHDIPIIERTAATPSDATAAEIVQTWLSRQQHASGQ